jgi:glycosyltransferase involved in cell wall biosynthesis
MQYNQQTRARLPLVTVVVISYNHGKYLEDCLNSVFEQSYPRIQCIVVDNASTDGSHETINQFRERTVPGKTFEAIMSPVNAHLTKAMMAGAAQASGAYIAFIDGDDYFFATCIEAHVQAHLVSRVHVGATSVDMYQSRDADLVIGGGGYFSDFVRSGRGQKTKFCRMENLDVFRFSGLSEGEIIKESDLHLVDRSMTRDWVWSPTSGLCFRREAVELMFSYAPNILGGTDTYLIRGISALTGSITIDRPLAVYRVHGGNMFTKHPALANFVSPDKKLIEASDAEVSAEIIACFKQELFNIAAKLENEDSYIEAIDMISTVGPGLRYGGSPASYALEFLVANRDPLVAAFGEAAYTRWRNRFLRSDWLAFLWIRFMRSLKHRASGMGRAEAGKT